MALEGKMSAVAPQLFTANGTAQGIITVADTAGFRTKQVAFLKNNSFASVNGVAVQVMRVLSPTKLIVGDIRANVSKWMPLDVSAFTVADGAYIGAEEQNKNNIPGDDHYRAVYESDPVVADRVVFVDKYGNFYDNNNPLPIIFDGTVAIGDVRVFGRNGNTIEPNADGSLNTINLNSGADVEWDDLLLARDPVTQDITTATYKKGGVTQRTLTMTYDANENLIEVKKT